MKLPQGSEAKEFMDIMDDSGPLDLATVIRIEILSRYKRFNGHKSKVARSLGISRATLYRYLDKYGVG